MKVLLNVESVSNVILGYEVYREENVFRNKIGVLADVDIDGLSYHLAQGHTAVYVDGKISYDDLNEDMFHRVQKAKEAWLKANRLATYEECLKDCVLNERPLSEVKTELDSRKAIAEELELTYKSLKEDYDRQTELANAQKRNVLCQSCATDKVALVSIMKDEQKYIDEWLSYHTALGFDHVYIYDNDTKPLLSEVPANVTIIPQEKTKLSLQQYVYNKWLSDYGHEYKWVMFLDGDEFIELHGKTVKQFLQPYSDNHKAGFVNLRWQHYGANGQVNYENRPVRERFTKRAEFEYPCDYGKGFVRTCATAVMHLHRAILKYGFSHINADGQPCEFDNHGAGGRKRKDIADGIAHIKHYFTKSHEEWVDKLKRGRVDILYSRRHDEFFEHNPDMKGIVEPLDLTQEY